MKTLGLVSAVSWLVVLASSTALAPVSQGQTQNGTPSKEISKSKPSCPAISVSCPSDIKDGEPLLFFVTIKGEDPGAVLTYSWTVFGGNIIEGQGTPTIKLKPSAESSFGGSLKIGGLDPSCSSTASCSTIICRIGPVSRKFDSFGAFSSNEEANKLASFAEALAQDPGARGYVLSYALRLGSAGEANGVADRAKTYLVSERGIEADRIVTVDAGFRDQATIELWVVPQGAAAPRPAKAVEPIQSAAEPGKKTGNPPRP